MTAALTRLEAHEVVRLLSAGVRDVGIATVCARGAIADQLARRGPSHPNGKLPAEHGTQRGYKQHEYDHTKPCLPCRSAHARHKASGRRRAAE